MKTFKNPTSDDQSSFLLRLYFGGGKERSDLERCNQRAYLDLSRTVWGINQDTDPHIHQHAEKVLRDALAALPAVAHTFDQEKFDLWHRALCDSLKEQHRKDGYVDESGKSLFTHGQAQKWINMALKYVFVFGEKRLPGYAPLYPFCHVPIDNIMIDQLDSAKCGEVPAFDGKTWSRLDDYAKYMEFQRWIRKTFSGSAPLAVEFFLWQGIEAHEE
jgi:hypothetical protein